MAKISRAEDIYIIIRNHILSGRWSAGDRLNDLELAEECQASRTSVREALFKLTETGIVEKEFWKGYFIKEITANMITNILEMRLAIETRTLKNFVATVTDQDILDLEHAINTSETYLKENDLFNYLISDFNFHEIIYTRQYNTCFASIMNNYMLTIHFIRYNSMGKDELFVQTATSSLYWHRYILESIKNKDSEEAEKRMIDHLLNHKLEAENNILNP